MSGCRRVIVCAFFLLMSAASAFASADGSCENDELYTRDEFFFDKLRLHLAKKQPTDVMKPLESFEGQIHASWAASNDCNSQEWWPNNFVIPFSVGHQALIGVLERDEATKISGTAYELGVAFRWHLSFETFGDPDSRMFVAYDDTHWSAHPGNPIIVDGQELTLPEHAAVYGVDVSRFQPAFDVFSLQWAHRFKLNPEIRIEYQVKNLIDVE